MCRVTERTYIRQFVDLGWPTDVSDCASCVNVDECELPLASVLSAEESENDADDETLPVFADIRKRESLGNRQECREDEQRFTF